MRESKGQLVARLQAEGRWAAALSRREALKATGLPAVEAWEQIASEFQPSDALPAVTGDNQEANETDQDQIVLPPWNERTGKRMPRAKIVEWVAQNLGADYQDAVLAAPCNAAAALLRWAGGVGVQDRGERSRRAETFWQMWARGIPPRVEADREERDFSDCQNVLEVLQSIGKAKGFPDPDISEEPGREK